MLKRKDIGHRPLSDLLFEVYERYRRPMFIAETGIEGRPRAAWLRHVSEQVRMAIERDVPIGGICWYPVTDYFGWADDRHCPCGLLGLPDESGIRPICYPLQRELIAQQELMRGA
jgi:hypothetical protein